MSTKKKSAIYYWDSSVIIGFLGGEPDKCDDVEHFLDEAESGDLIIITSSFTLVEVIKLKKKQPILVEKQKLVTAFFQKDYFRFIDATRKVTEDARNLIWKYPSLNPKDAVHLASALEFARNQRLDAIHSYDTDFTNLDGKLGLSCPIEKPIPIAPTLGLIVPRKVATKRTKPNQERDVK